MSSLAAPTDSARSARASVTVAAILTALAVIATGVVLLVTRRGGDLAARTKVAAERHGTFRFTMRQKFAGAGTQQFGGASPFSLDGAVDLNNATSRLVTTISAPQIRAKCTYLSTRDHLFVSVHPSRRASIGAPWVRAGANSLLASQGFRVRPDHFYDEGSDFFENLRADGSATVRRVRVTKYVGDARLTEIAPGAEDNPALAAFDGTVPIAVFIDDEDLVRRLEVEMRSGQGFAVRTTVDFFDYGEPVAIALPRPADVTPGDPQIATAACFPSRPRS